MTEELPTALSFAKFSDGSTRAGQAEKAPQETSVRRFGPTHVTRSLPAILTERIEPPVVADSVRQVGLEVVSRNRCIQCPYGRRSGKSRGQLGDSGARYPTRDLFIDKGCQDRRLSWQHRLRRLVTRNTNVRHATKGSGRLVP